MEVTEAFKTKMIAEYENCKKLSDALIVDKGPKFLRTFGRQIYFNKCIIVRFLAAIFGPFGHNSIT